MHTIALWGAAGKVGARITEKLRHAPEFRMCYVEAGQAGLAWLRQRGLDPCSQADAIREADTVILAIPDTLIGAVASEIVPQLSPMHRSTSDSMQMRSCCSAQFRSFTTSWHKWQ